MTKLPYLSAARVGGADAGAFLQAQSSADILALQSGESTFACYCNPKGRVIALLLVFAGDGDYRIVANSVLLPRVLERLKIYILRSKVELEAMGGWRVFGASGEEIQALREGSSVSCPAGFDFGYCVTERDPGNDDGVDAWRGRELRAGIAWLDTDTTEQFIPQMLGFDAIGAVSFSKGCYPGQEVVARARHLGRVKRKPLLVESEAIPGAGPGSRVDIQRGGGWFDAVVVDRAPLRDPGHALYFLVARGDPDVPASRLEFAGSRYRCATI